MNQTQQEKALKIILDCRIAEKTTIEGDCHIWYGTLRSGSGLPIIAVPLSRPKRQVQIRRFIYETRVRPLKPHEYVFDTCENKRCINPDHLVLINRKDAWRP